MAIDYDKLVNLNIPDVEQTYTQKDSILYALGLGFGHDPVDAQQLRFVDGEDPQTVPTLPVVLASPGSWMRDLGTGIDYLKVVHGEQGLVLHKPPPAAGVVIGKTRVVDVIDKGAGRGALVLSERILLDKASGDLLATITQTAVARGDGGFGGPARATPAVLSVPDRVPDAICDLPTVPQAALIYRLSGDYNPLHADPDVARAAGFARPILHGLATYGVAGHAILKTVCSYDPRRLKSISCRFTAPVYPGEAFRTEIWRDGSMVSFQTRAIGRDVIAIANGRAEIAVDQQVADRCPR